MGFDETELHERDHALIEGLLTQMNIDLSFAERGHVYLADELNDSYANDPGIVRRSGGPTVTMHPDDAAGLGLAEGETVRLRNDAGSVELAVRLEPIVPRGVLLSHKGRWPKQQDGRGTVNAVHEPRSSDIAGCSAVHGTEVQVELVT